MKSVQAETKLRVLDLTLPQLEAEFEKLGEKPFRARQVYEWVWKKGVADFEAMSNLAAPLRERLKQEAALNPLSPFRAQVSKRDGTSKFLFRCADGELIEAVFLPHEGRNTACLSTQVGCAMACAFCATGDSGFSRHLSAGEIVGQVLSIEKETGQPLRNLVYMGMGEPLHNYEAVRDSLHILLAPQGRHWGPRHITVSTCGVVPGIERLHQDGLKVRLAISLHSADDETRAKIMPINRRYPLKELMKAVKAYQKATDLQITFEYTLFAGLNDSDEQAKAVSRLLRGLDAKVNLIPYNPVSGLPFEVPSFDRVIAFQNILKDSGTLCMIRTEKGGDIDAACGQLRRREL